MLKRVIFTTLFSLLMLTPIWAQMKGNTYYDWVGTLGSSINCEVLIELDGRSKLAMGEINYFRKDGGVSHIQLYGERAEHHDDGTDVYVLTEHLPDGKVSGVLQFSLLKGRFNSGFWTSADKKRQYTFYLNQSKPFPYSKWETFFTPISDSEETTGVYRSLWQPETGKIGNEFWMVINPSRPFDDYEMKQIDVMLNDDVLATGTSMVSEEGKLRVTSKEGGIYEAWVYRDFVFLDKVSHPEGTSKVANPEGYFIRQAGEKVLPLPSFENGIWARLKDERLTVTFVRDRIQETLGECFEDMAMCLDVHDAPLNGIEGSVSQIYCGDIGQDIHPILALRNSAGKAQFISIFEAIEKGSLTVSRPLPNIPQYFRDFTDSPQSESTDEDSMGYATVYARDHDGKTYEIIPNHFTVGDWQIETGKGDKLKTDWLEFDEEWHFYYNHSEGSFDSENWFCHNYYGYCWFEVDENKQFIIKYRIEEENESTQSFENRPSSVEGSFRYDDLVTDQDDNIMIKITPLSGFSFGAKKLGKTISLKRIQVVG